VLATRKQEMEVLHWQNGYSSGHESLAMFDLSFAVKDHLKS